MPNALMIGIDYELFFHLTPNEIKVFGDAENLRRKRAEEAMLTQATYIYEAFNTVMNNWFGKTPQKWRTKTYRQEYEESQRTDEEIADANGLAILHNLELSMERFNLTHKNKRNKQGT